MPRVAAHVLLLTVIGASVAPSLAATVSEAEKLLLKGSYEECIELAEAEIEEGIRLEQWRHVKAEAELAIGRYADAMATVEEGLESYPQSIRMRMLAHQVFRFNGRDELAAMHLGRVGQLIETRSRRYWSTNDLLTLGRYLLMQGEDARRVLELCYDPITAQHPDFIIGHLASAELALEKYDHALAAQTLESAPEAAQSDPRYHYLLARAFADGDPKRASAALAKALELNPRHPESLLMQVERLIDAEQYVNARSLLAKVLEVNSKHPVANAYQSVLHNIAGDEQGESSARNAALSSWKSNPEVDHTIGRKLSDKYRFSEGADYQRRALEMDSGYLPARVQLAQDLLRLGEEEEGWRLIQEVSATDGYNVVAHNLATLHDSLVKHQVLADDAFYLRMEQHEAAVYGERVLDLLSKAKQTICEKYDVSIEEPVVVDIFPNKNDFAVRTFGIPGADGFLGVCFGNVITANSPAALGDTKANWQAVLWHEFCHVVTLKKSANKMPRWLSEGISVYEELEQDETWGQRMTPTYRQMVLDGEMAPLSELSSMFLAPKSPLHLQFAYYESSMAVRYLIENYGFETIKIILDDLAAGVSINEALVRHADPLGKLNSGFQEYLTSEAEGLAPKLNWDEFDLPPAAEADAVAEWLEGHPDNFYGLIRHAQTLQRSGDWQAAIDPASRLRELYPEYTGAGNAYTLLSQSYHELNDEASEREALEALAARDSEATGAFFRLAEMAEQNQDWGAVLQNAERLLAVDPLTPIPHRYLARAADALEQPTSAIAAYRALLEFETSDPVNAHYRLATLLQDEGRRDEARREVLLALEDAPRFLDAHKLLLELVDMNDEAPSTDAPSAEHGERESEGQTAGDAETASEEP
ncbi:tetratricopeptide repeat protein [Posidoniimonas corsicana]|uniref:Tetratricopeptide repeat protein n=1 Tax=Posidoniimonas corsicana TaxID=1938618 RepID=A0A5C5V7T6_9BACT|nr:peptidase MA family metallohydrolase [Posidoniimonas corsicana]TWT33919.1 tetratricopeptide repeat protein [Posidoniimonas corsicana]